MINTDWVLIMVNIFAIVVAMAVALRKIKEQRYLQKQNNSITIMKNFIINSSLIHASTILADIHHDENRDVVHYAYKKAPEKYDDRIKKDWQDDRANLLLLVNHLEIISVGIIHNIYDRNIIYQSSRSMFTSTFKRMELFIKEYRRLVGVDSFAENFERIAKEFNAS